MARYKPELKEDDAHERNRRLTAEQDQPIVCPKCCGTGTHIDYKSKIATMCLNCEGEGVVYE